MKYKTREPRHVPKYTTVFGILKIQKVYFQGIMTSYHKPPFYIVIFDHLTTFDSFSPLNKARYKSEEHCIVTGSIQASQVAMSRRQKTYKFLLIQSERARKTFKACTLSKLNMQVRWSAPPQPTSILSLLRQVLLSSFC